MLDHAYDAVDHISLHAYYEERDGDLASFLASSRRHGPASSARSSPRPTTSAPSAAAASGSTCPSTSGTSGTSTSFAGHTNLELEQTPAPHRGHLLRRGCRRGRRASSTPSCATPTGSRSPARRSSSTSSGCSAPRQDGPAWRQTIFHPFAQTARLARGTVAARGAHGRPARDRPARRRSTPSTPAPPGTRRPATSRCSSSTGTRASPSWSPSTLRGFAGLQVAECLRLEDDDPRRTNTAAAPRAVQPRPDPGVRVEGGCLELRLSPASWTAVALDRPTPLTADRTGPRHRPHPLRTPRAPP